jgi:anti-sigma regulatory factor (Ser/Thr protein kinase)
VHATLTDVVQDIALNALEAGSPLTEVRIVQTPQLLRAIVADTGKGMNEQELAAAQDPFVTAPGKHPSRQVGLGLSFLHQLVEGTEGELDIASEPGKGTTVQFSVSLEHVDCPPMGDIPGLAFSLMCYPGDYELVFSRALVRETTGEYTVRRSELREALGDLESVASLGLLREFLSGEEASLFAVEV